MSQEIKLKEEWQSEFEPSTYRVPIRWTQVRYKLNEKGVIEFHKGKRKICLGFCMATNHLMRMQPTENMLGTMLVLIMQDTLVLTKDGKPPYMCEEGQCCLNIDCPLNHTTPESFAAGIGVSEKIVKGWNWEAVTSYRKLRWE